MLADVFACAMSNGVDGIERCMGMGGMRRNWKATQGSMSLEVHILVLLCCYRDISER